MPVYMYSPCAVICLRSGTSNGEGRKDGLGSVRGHKRNYFSALFMSIRSGVHAVIPAGAGMPTHNAMPMEPDNERQIERLDASIERHDACVGGGLSLALTRRQMRHRSIPYLIL
jgi:hypothetical protein